MLPLVRRVSCLLRILLIAMLAGAPVRAGEPPTGADERAEEIVRDVASRAPGLLARYIRID
ncbi:MAG: hypothetical protein V3R77_05455, partial [Candidatus Binatia bacterium]